jgi:hypothetical protein
LSKELLRQVGTFIHGQEWQAPLARELHVNERTMRRWAAGTEEIPRGVWRDLGSHLETGYHALGIFLTAVKKTAGEVEVHSFQAWDSMRGDMVQPSAKSTAERIARVGGQIVPGTSEWMSPEFIDEEGRVKEPNPGFQTQAHNQPRPR